MRRLLNTIYITNEQAYLALDGENFICEINNEEKLRIPFDNIESIVCMNYMGCSPALMGKCVGKLIPINFVSPQGKFLAKVCGETKGNVFLRISQISVFKEKSLKLAQNTIAAKISNSRQVLKRSMHDNPLLRDDHDMRAAVDCLISGIERVYGTTDIESAVGVEGYCAQAYFSVFSKLFTGNNNSFHFKIRTKRPPLDPINAALSFVYTLATSEYASALETVGLDSYIGYCHALKSGRSSLACDMVEEARCLVERFVITLFNLKILGPDDFTNQISGAVWLNNDGVKKVLSRWQEKKHTDMMHPYLKQKIPCGLLPYVQSNLMAKFVRGDISAYPVFLLK